MQATRKPKKQQPNRDSDINEFNRFCLTQRDINKEPFFIMQGTQVVQNYRCQLNLKSVMDAYRLSIK